VGFMTIELFKNNSYIKSFEAEVVNNKKIDDTYHVELSQTAFYPEGGGQPSDLGEINGIRVMNVYREDDKIFHILESDLATRDVQGNIDWERRFDFMQQHTGQHLLSAVIEKLHEGNTIGFHLSNEYTTIDIDKKLKETDLNLIETEANRIIYANLRVITLYPTSEELKALPLRKAPAVTENIRVTEIEDYDHSPCGGTHLNTLGELGIIKIKKFENYKSGVRIEFVCGHRALKDYQLKNTAINYISQKLTTTPTDVIAKFDGMVEEQNRYRKTIKELNKKLLAHDIEALQSCPITINETTVYKKIFTDIEFGDIRTMAATLVNKEDSVCILGLVSGNKANIMLACSKNLVELNMKELFAEIIPLVEGRGGGNRTAAQGGGDKLDGLTSAIDNAFFNISEILKDKVN